MVYIHESSQRTLATHTILTRSRQKAADRESPADRESVEQKVLTFFKEENVTLLGAAPEDSVNAIMGAAANFQQSS